MLAGPRSERAFSEPPMPALHLAAKIFDVAVVTLIFTAFS
jgi:hypothetical protein